MLHLQIDPHSGVPVYRQLTDQVKYYAASGTLRAGAQLPSIRDLARSLSINPTTVVKAYNELRREGLIELRQGKGAFVVEVPRTLTEAEQRKALARTARQLAVEAKQMGASVDVVRGVLESEMKDIDLSGT